MKRHILPILFILILSWWAIRPLITAGFFPMHDDTQVGRVVVMGNALRNGQFPVRWVSDLGYGYGYPIFNFYGPLPYYVGGLLYAIGFSGLTATKIMFALGILLPALTTYIALFPFVGRLGATVGSVFYLYAPYHAVQMYVRGAVGEFWTLIFFPLILFGIQKKSGIIGGIGLAGVILSHTLLGYATTLFLVVGLIFKKYHVSLLLLGLGLSAFFWLPAITEMRYTNVAAQIGPTANFADHFVCPGELWSSPWGFGGSSPGCLDGISFKLGKIHIIAAAVGLVVRPLWAGLLIVVLSIFFLLPQSEFIWRSIPGFSYLQYPWRFLTLATFGLSILSANAIAISRYFFIRWGIGTTLIVFVIMLEAKWFAPQFTYAKPAADFETTEELRYRVSKISDEYLPPDIIRPTNVTGIAGAAIRETGELEVGTDIDKETYKKFQLFSKGSRKITVARAYFPGWHYLVNGKETIEYLDRGLPVLSIPEGESVVEMRFTNTPIRTLANTVTLLVIVWLIYTYGKKTHA